MISTDIAKARGVIQRKIGMWGALPRSAEDRGAVIALRDLLEDFPEPRPLAALNGAGQ